MKRRLFFMFLFVVGVLQLTIAQTDVPRIQGHERPDLIRQQSMKPHPDRRKIQLSENFTFDQITFWVGKGSKRAALVVDWFDGKGGTLVWGFRWDGTATGYDMVKAIAKADPRFLFLTHSTNLGYTIAGLGYDLNKNGNQTLLIDGNAANPYTPTLGVVTTDAYNYDSWSCPDSEDHWQSGWYKGYWSYQVKNDPNSEFAYSSLGASSRQLQDGSWDGWGYQDGWENMTGVQPRYPYTSATSPLPAYASFWSETGKNETHLPIISTQTARKASEWSEKWKIDITSSWSNGGQPIVVNGHIYLAVNNKLMKIDAETGEKLKEVTLGGSCGFFSMIAYGEGKIFVPMEYGVLQAFNAETLEPLWITAKRSTFMQQLCPVVYHDGYVYTGMWSGSTGVYYCVTAEDEDVRRTDEVKVSTWESDNVGFYWSGGTVVGDYIFFGGDNGVMQSRHRKTGVLVDSYSVGGTIRSGSSYDFTTQTLFFTAKEQRKVFGLKIKEDGTFDKSVVMSASLLGDATSTPMVYNGRVYTTSGTISSSGGINVLSASTLAPIYSINLGGPSQSTPLLSTAYATEDNGHEVYLYVCLNNSKGEIVCVKDYEGNQTPSIQFRYAPSTLQYCTHSLVADEQGSVYYKNDSKYLFALKTTPSVQTSVEQVSNGQIICWSQHGLSFKGCDGFRFALYNLNGVLIERFMVNEVQEQRSLSLPSGLYLIKGENGVKTIDQKILVK